MLWSFLVLLLALFYLGSSASLPPYILVNGGCVWFRANSLLPTLSLLLITMTISSDNTRRPENPSFPLGPETETIASPSLGNSGSSTQDPPPLPQNLPPSSTGSFSDALRFGVGNQQPQPPVGGESNPPNHVNPDPSLPLPANLDIPTPLDDLRTFCLLAKLWGESLPIPLIISKTKVDWKHVKGPVEYIELGNGWVLLRFATVADKDFVWFNRPWFVKGLNLVLSQWVPYFDPYTASIVKVDQWVRISRLPWEFWVEQTLTNILRPIGEVIRIDHNTLLRKKGRFARVCVNIDISNPLPGTLSIPTPLSHLFIPITYEGLHEVCALCGANDHLLEHCSRLPITPKIEVVVEKFQAHGISDLPSSSTIPPPADSSEKWIRISPKKRGRSFPPSFGKKPSSGIHIAEPVDSQAVPANSKPTKETSPALNDKGKAVLTDLDCKHPASLSGCDPSLVAPYSPIVAPTVRPTATALGLEPVVVPSPSHTRPVVIGLPSASPTSPLQATEVLSSPSNITPSDHFSAEDFMDQDGTEDFFLDLDDLNEPAVSSDSVKKRKLEEGEECSSHSMV